SETSSPRSMIALASIPIGVCAETAARSMSPVESCRIPWRSTRRAACVPLPAPGGPSRMMFIALPCRTAGLAQPTLQLGLLDQVAVLVRQQVRLNLADRIDRDIDHDQ